MEFAVAKPSHRSPPNDRRSGSQSRFALGLSPRVGPESRISFCRLVGAERRGNGWFWRSESGDIDARVIPAILMDSLHRTAGPGGAPQVLATSSVGAGGAAAGVDLFDAMNGQCTRL